MNLKELLLKKKKVILEKWFDLIIESYQPVTSNFLKQEKNRFANPVGHIISEGTEVLFDELVYERDSDRVISALDSIIRIRAVQDLMPSQAISFVSLLKKAVREEVTRDEACPASQREARGRWMMDDKNKMLFELLQFETKIDMLASLAFDIYLKCREEIYEIRVNEAKVSKDMALRLLKIMKQVD